MNQIKPADTQRADGEIIPPELVVKAMRDSGYKNTAYALAELIDNSVQANASNVEAICVEERHQVDGRSRRRIQEIGILDNGEGMTPETLRLALQFGNGTHLEDRKGIGRFGMGLPNSSISQCRRVEVWTWKSGPDNAMHTYLDVKEIENRKMSTIPMPLHKRLPDKWRARSKIVSTKGTLVLWRHFDDHRLSWRGAKATLNNMETLVGRVYRKFIDKGLLSIRLLALLEGGAEPIVDELVRVNDPLYLMHPSSTPTPFDTKPMFQPWGKGDEKFPICLGGVTHEILVRMSWARQETLPEDKSDRGDKRYGKHAKKNIGLSIIREGRELDLDPSWTSGYDPRDRWWGVEIEFPSTLDEIFGVTNTKQSATIFSRLAQFEWEDEADSGESQSDFYDRIQRESEPRALLLEVATHIRKQIGQMRKRIQDQGKGRRKKSERYDKPTVEDLATTKFQERAKQGHPTDADSAEFTEEDRKKFEQNLRDDKHYTDKVSRDIANATLTRKRKVVFLPKAMDGYAFFDVEHQQGGLTAIVFNTNHPFHKKLIEVLGVEQDIDDESDSALIERIHNAADTLELLLAAWARYEMEEVQKQKLEWLFEMRQEWGRMARFFLTEQEKE